MKHLVEGGEIAQLIKRLKKANGADPDIDADIHSVVLQPIEAPSDEDIPHPRAAKGVARDSECGTRCCVYHT